MKLLIAEDSMTLRLTLQVIAQKSGFDTQLAEDGQQAWDILSKENAPKLVLLDWEMPHMNGLDVCRKVRGQSDENPPYIILLTARTETKYVVMGLNAGANDYVSKPFDTTELLARLNVGKRVVELQQQAFLANERLLAERSIVENTLLAMRESRYFDGRHLRDLQAPVERTSGDVLFSAFRLDGAQYIFIGDFTGHGLTAAIGGPMVSDVFYTMARKGRPIREIMIEANKHLAEKMPTGLFMAAVLIEVSAGRDKITLYNCGMLDVLVFHDGKETHRLTSNNMPLGIAENRPFVQSELQTSPGDRLYAYSDGIVEVMDEQGRQFGVDGLSNAISDMLEQNSSLETLRAKAMEHQAGNEQLDDITLVEITC